MDTSSIPQLTFRKHTRAPSRSPTRSPTRQRLTDDILVDLSPATTLEAFTSPSGKLKASVEAATPSERAFGIRATIASKKIQEWLTELSAWPWPKDGGSDGFEMPHSKRRKILADSRSSIDNTESNTDPGYMGSLPAKDVEAYEVRIEEILEDMDDLHVEEIKSTVLNSHLVQVSRPSSAASHTSNSSIMPTVLSNYTKMDDFTAVVTATVLQALPNLSKLMRLMDVWSIRLTVLRKVPPLLDLLDDVEIALSSGWQAIKTPREDDTNTENAGIGEEFMDRNTFEAMRDVLQDKVTNLGRELDYMLDTLEGRADTLPERWLDSMEQLEKGYGEWVVSGERMVREGEWNKLVKARKAEEARRRAEEEARLAAERKRMEEERIMLEELARQEAERIRQKEEERLRLEEAARVEAARIQKEKEEALRLEEEEAAEAARLRAEETKRREEEALRLREAEAAKAAELSRQAEEARAQKDMALKLEEEKAAEAARAAELARRAEQELAEKEMALKIEQERAAEAARLEAEQILRDEEALRLQDVAKRDAEAASESSTSDASDVKHFPAPPTSNDLSSPNSIGSSTVPNKAQDATPIAAHKHEDGWIVVETAERTDSHAADQSEQDDHNLSQISVDSTSTPHISRNISLVSGYTPSEPSPEIFEAQPAEYMRPTISPIRSKYSASEIRPKTPLVLLTGEETLEPALALLESPSPIFGMPPMEDRSFTSSAGAQDAPLNDLEELGYFREDIEPPALARRTSITCIKFPIKRIDLPRRDSNLSTISTPNNRQRRNTASSPLISSPLAVNEPSEAYDESPSTSRVGNFQTAYDYTPPGTPPQTGPIFGQQPSVPLSPISRSSFTDSLALETETPSSDASLDSGSNGPVSQPPSPKKHTVTSSDDQLQAQISSLLESIPARIRLASSPPEESKASPRALKSESLRVPKHRSSLGSSSVRSQSSLSMRSRAPTPSFTLAPAYGKGTSRPRPQSNNPDIKLYHLSRFGETPIKLFVRLVGENGERVMVRVGGGWADLGEYLKEYASHHGRRNGGKDDKVEIQDMGSRNVSGASIASSSSTLRGSDRASPSPKATSAADSNRPMSSLYIRKTRKSDADSTAAVAATVNLRSPSTPVAFTSQSASRLNTPPSTASSDVSLGLAGPKRKNIKISERDAEWVESMKEKVRIASMDKEMRELKQRDREERETRRERGSFGDFDRVGGTRRLFKKG